MEKIPCEDCGESVLKKNTAKHKSRKHPLPNSKTEEETVPAKKSKLTREKSPVCENEISKKHFARHMKNMHSYVSTKSALCQTFADYELANSDSADTHSFLASIEKKCVHFLEKQVSECDTLLKINFILSAHFVKMSGETQCFPVHSGNKLFSKSAVVLETMKEILEELQVNQEDRAFKGSGWFLSSTPNHKLEVHVNSFNPIAASCHIKLPKFIKKKRAILNIKNKDSKCFLYAVLAKLNPVDSKKNANQVSHYEFYAHEILLIFENNNIHFPVSLHDVPKF